MCYRVQLPRTMSIINVLYIPNNQIKDHNQAMKSNNLVRLKQKSWMHDGFKWLGSKRFMPTPT
jgi:hypothetical protein